jgi:quercetin dioxygenase-like cupin family protein
MLRTALALAAAAALSACVSVHVEERGGDATLAGVQSASVRACPLHRTQANAQTQGFGETSGVTIEDVALTPVAGEPARALRLRRIVAAPGGVIAWHDHTQVQGMALLVSGEMVELRNTCLDRLVYRAGDIAIEDVNTAHSWRNESDEEAIVLVSHVVAR